VEFACVLYWPGKIHVPHAQYLCLWKNHRRRARDGNEGIFVRDYMSQNAKDIDLNELEFGDMAAHSVLYNPIHPKM